MDEPLTLIGFRYSVYTRIVRMALIEMGLDAEYVEANPFAADPDPVLAKHAHFNRVPVLRHGGFTLTETAAITCYLDMLHDGPGFTPNTATAQARMAEIIGIIDAYGYHPMVRQVFSHAVYRPHFHEITDPEQIAAGLKAAEPVLAALDAIAGEGRQLGGSKISLADIHFAPMIAYFILADQGAALLSQYPSLFKWWAAISTRPSLIKTNPFSQP